jgi:TRAP-type transport system periplasmic protein
MTGLDRRAFLKATVSAAAAVGTGVQLVPSNAWAQAAPLKFKFGNDLPASHSVNVRLREAIDAIKAETNGRVEISLFPNNQLGSDNDMMSQLRSGALELATMPSTVLSTLVTAASLTGLGFVFTSYDKVWPAMDGDLGGYIRKQIEKAGLFAFEKQYDNGYRQMTSSTRPIKSPDDLKGFKIRVPPSPLWTSMFKAFDAAPMSINFSEVYSALQTKVAEGQENPLSIIFFGKLFEVQKYLSETNHMWDGFWFLANGKMWNGLPADVRDVIQKNFNASAITQREDIAKQNASFKKDLTEKGMEFIAVDQKPFRAKLEAASFYKEWRGKYGEEAWAALEKYAGKIA